MNKDYANTIQDDLISRAEAIDACCRGWNNTAEDCIRNIKALPSRITEYKTFCGVPIEEAARIVQEHNAEPKMDEENELKFYYVESIDDYWIGQRLDNFYYADWHDGLGFVWSKSRYLPWGEHIVNENTLWKEHTYPSEPVEIPFTEWIVGFVKKYFTEPRTGKWKLDPNGMDWNIPAWRCSECGFVANYIGVEANGLGNNPMNWAGSKFCPQCGARITGYER